MATSLGAAGDDAGFNHEDIAREFVELYYARLANEPDKLYRYIM